MNKMLNWKKVLFRSALVASFTVSLVIYFTVKPDEEILNALEWKKQEEERLGRMTSVERLFKSLSFPTPEETIHKRSLSRFEKLSVFNQIAYESGVPEICWTVHAFCAVWLIWFFMRWIVIAYIIQGSRKNDVKT